MPQDEPSADERRREAITRWWERKALRDFIARGGPTQHREVTMPQDEVEAMVERLTRSYQRGPCSGDIPVNPDGPAAAALLTRLSAQLKVATAEVERLSEALWDIESFTNGYGDVAGIVHKMAGDARRAALKGSAQEQGR